MRNDENGSAKWGNEEKGSIEKYDRDYLYSPKVAKSVEVSVKETLRIVKKVLVMTVSPGNAGQMYLPYVGKKITKLLFLKEDMEFEIYWDGACSADKILEFAPKGVKGGWAGQQLCRLLFVYN